MDDVEKARVVELHASLVAAHLRDRTGFARAAAGRDHGRVPVVCVHQQLGLVVGTPESEGDEPGVQQARMVGVLDVLLHQLPVAGDPLAVIAQNAQPAAVEHAVEIAQDRRAHEVLERLHRMVEGGEHDAAAQRHLELVQSVVCAVEVLGHSALDLAVALDATAERNAQQVSLEAVAPLMVGTDEVGLVAVARAAELQAPVRTDIFDDADAPFEVAHHDHRAFADGAALEVAGLGDLGLQPNIAPVGAVEETIKLASVQRVAGVGRKRYAAAVARLPWQLCVTIRWLVAHAVLVARAHDAVNSGVAVRRAHPARWALRLRPHAVAAGRVRAAADRVAFAGE